MKERNKDSDNIHEGKIILCCGNHPFATFDPISKDTSQFSICYTVQLVTDRFKKADFVGDLRLTNAFFTFPNKSKSDGETSAE
jgi:hypothetical protein